MGTYGYWILDTIEVLCHFQQITDSQQFFFQVFISFYRGTEKEHVLSRVFAPFKTDVYDSAFLINNIPASSASFEASPSGNFFMRSNHRLRNV